MTVAFAALAIAGANAQTKFGVRAGLNLADVAIKSEDVKEESKIRPAFYVGGLAEFAFNDVVLMDAGLTYSNQGAKPKEGDGALVQHALNLPVWFKYDFAGFRPKVGVNLGFLTKAELKVKNNDGNSETLSFNPDKTFDFGLGVGAEYNLPFGLFFDATFNLGLTDVSTKEKTTEQFPVLNMRNRVIQIGVGYKF